MFPNRILIQPQESSEHKALGTELILTPRLPPELEYIIFTLVASKQPEMFSTLNLVCRRVKDWAEPFEMECVFLATTSLTRHPLVCKRRHLKWHSTDKLLKLRTRVARGVRGVMLGWHIVIDPCPIYPLLPSLEYVVWSMRHGTVIRFPGSPMRTILSLPIRRLGFDSFHALDAVALFSAEWVSHQGSLSPTLTHLELPSASGIGDYLDDLPALSHLCVDVNQHRNPDVFFEILYPRRLALQRLLQRESFVLLVLRILPYTLNFCEYVCPSDVYIPLLDQCSIPVQMALCLETSIDITRGLCNYMDVPDTYVVRGTGFYRNELTLYTFTF
ncbi:hypothetical protein DFH06DRAFT_67286 [Mycena polygramma]|nr:hypothetical protein DFH06DRAFT_67286 [Mycena polygramma]